MKTLLVVVFAVVKLCWSGAIIADHGCTDITTIPVSAIQAAKDSLHIAYGHTSHGSQITDGMRGLVEFMNAKAYPNDLFKWNSHGSNGALHLYEGDGYGEGDLDHDAGYYPNWVNETRDYLGEPNAAGRGSNHPEMNVIMWSWCGQLSWYSSEDVQQNYLDEMNQLEMDYPGVTFVYMTGHSDGSGLEGTLHQNNQHIRNFCVENDKVLFDFYDIECYDPDGNYYGDRHVSDDCSYDGGNWAIEWQNAHEQGVDWYDCDAAHSQPLNANQKAYAIWWLWARLAGWEGQTTNIDEHQLIPHSEVVLLGNYPNPFNASTTLRFKLNAQADVSVSVTNIAGERILDVPAMTKPAGNHSFNISFVSQPSGIYYYRLCANHQTAIGRLLLLR